MPFKSSVYMFKTSIINLFKHINEWIILKEAGGHMNETFKINMHFDEKGEELESLIELLIIDVLEKK